MILSKSVNRGLAPTLFTLALAALSGGCSVGAVEQDDKKEPQSAEGTPEITQSQLRAEITGGRHEMFEHAYVQIDRVELMGDDDIVLTETGGRFDLLALDSAVTAVLADAEVPTGCYKQVRLIISSAEVTLRAGTTFSDGSRTKALQMPSAATSGVKVDLFAGNEASACVGGGRGVQVAASATVLVVVLDPTSNFVIEGHEGTAGIKGVKFTPHVKCFVQDVAGSISGTVKVAEGFEVSLDDVIVHAEQIDSVLPTSVQTLEARSSAADGTFALRYLAPAKYRLTVEGLPEGFVSDPVERAVDVVAGQHVTGIAFIVVGNPTAHGTIQGKVTVVGEDTPVLEAATAVHAELLESDLDAADQTPMADAELAADGTYSLDVAPGRYRVTVAVMEGFAAEPMFLEVNVAPAQQQTGADFELSAVINQGTLIGRLVLDVGVDIDLEGQEVTCESRDDDRTYMATLDGEHEFRMDMDAGTYEVRLEVPFGFVAESDPVVIVAGETTEYEVIVRVDVDVSTP